MTPRPMHTAQAGFEAARHIPSLPSGHPQRGLHGHSFLARVRADTAPGWAPFPGADVTQLRLHLEEAVQTLNHSCLNLHMPDPSDAQLAHWLHQRLQQPGLHLRQVGLQSTPHSGVDIDAHGQPHLWRRHVLYAAHQLPHVPAGHKCGRMHGHGFEVLLHARIPPTQPLNMAALDAAWAPLHQRLDHAILNHIPGLENPTSEVLSGWLWQQLQPQLPELSSVTVYETASCGCSHDGHHYRIWKDMTLDSAVRLRHAPAGHPAQRVHGRTYTLRLHLCAPLDAVMGWTVDFGDVKRLFHPVFQAIDHQPLHQLPELAHLPDLDCANLASWVLQRAQADLPALDRVDLHETPGCGSLAWRHHPTPALLPV